MSMKIAVKHVEQVLSQVHVSDGVDLFVSVNEDTPWFLAISMTPQMFDTFHVPLVHNSHNSFTSTLIYLSEQSLVSLIDDLFLETWEVQSQTLDEEVDHVLVTTFLKEKLHSTSFDL